MKDDERKRAIELVDVNIDIQKNGIENAKYSTSIVGLIITSTAILTALFICSLGQIYNENSDKVASLITAAVCGIAIIVISVWIISANDKNTTTIKIHSKKINGLLELKKRLIKNELKTDTVSIVEAQIASIIK
ncbi:MAG: hypothetical protein WC588_02545 [Candidatus Micrarchaeia archaeon]